MSRRMLHLLLVVILLATIVIVQGVSAQEVKKSKDQIGAEAAQALAGRLLNEASQMGLEAPYVGYYLEWAEKHLVNKDYWFARFYYEDASGCILQELAWKYFPGVTGGNHVWNIFLQMVVLQGKTLLEGEEYLKWAVAQNGVYIYTVKNGFFSFLKFGSLIDTNRGDTLFVVVDYYDVGVIEKLSLGWRVPPREVKFIYSGQDDKYGVTDSGTWLSVTKAGNEVLIPPYKTSRVAIVLSPGAYVLSSIKVN